MSMTSLTHLYKLGSVRTVLLHGVAAQQPRRVLVLAELGDLERRPAVVVLGVHLRPRRQERRDRLSVAALRGEHERRRAVVRLGLHLRTTAQLEKRSHSDCLTCDEGGMTGVERALGGWRVRSR